MFKKLLILTTAGMLLSGCYMAPLALMGPITSGFSTASLIQSGISYSTGYVVKKSTGKTISQHALNALTRDVMQQAYFPKNKNSSLIIAP